MEAYEVFKDLAIILVAAKLFGLIARKFKTPQVVGEIIAGLIIGPSLLGWVETTDFLSEMAAIGVVLLMFTAGLETDLKDLKETGVTAFFVALMGVLTPLVFGTVMYLCFYGFDGFGTDKFLEALFIGTIMTATSVSITVQALRELGYLKGKLGTTIVSAAIIDDVIGIIVLTIVLGMKNGGSSILETLIKTLLFFVLAVGAGVIVYRLFKAYDKKYPHTRRIPIMGLAFCLVLSYVAEKYFGIADITGAYVAGVILCNMRDSEYIAEKMDINSYMLFGPVFFASIGIKTNIREFTLDILLFSVVFVIVALLSKIIGCSLVGKIAGFNWPDSLKMGVGMMTRGEVALIVSQKGLAAGMIEPVYFMSVIMLIIVSSIATPMILKSLFTKYPSPKA
ncbi:MAG TPA: sodium:proton antiporter [Lachnospiraceae bacterium]|nr:sodium:proton antiporter [Lachnospiraceae bacterium]